MGYPPQSDYCGGYIGSECIGYNFMYGTMKEEVNEEDLTRKVTYLVVHCSATRCDKPYSVEQLRADHLARGFKEIGYHFFITRNGVLYHPRPIAEEGAHAYGFNKVSIGICYEGGLDEEGYPADTRTWQQKEVLIDVLGMLKKLYPQAEIVGHYQLSPGIKKACPCFDARTEYSKL